MRCSKKALCAMLGLLLGCLISPVFSQSLVINELVASNSGGIADEDGDFEDWIELYNAGTAPVNLDGYGLSDDTANPFRWVLPQAILQPGEYLLVWASGKDRGPNQDDYRNGILRQVYMDIPGGGVSDLTDHPSFPDEPTSQNLVTGYFESSTNIADNFGQRMHGYIKAPATGNYTFWLSGDNGSRLSLSTDTNPANAVAIASIPDDNWSSYPRHWDRFTSQKSALILLQEGQFYYICALMKEDVGGDHLAVRWQLPSGVVEEPIPTSRLYVDVEELHTNFSISTDGETIQLTEPNGTVADSAAPVELICDVSYGRAVDGGAEWVYFAEPTPGAANESSVAYAGIVKTPQFSQASGFYTSPFDLTLSSEDTDAAIYYTLDGSVPNSENLAGTSYGYKNQYPGGTMLYRDYRSFLYENAMTIAAHPVPLDGIAGINTENSASPGTPSSWSVVEGDAGSELVQSSLATNIRLMFGDASWTNYEFTCQALKNAGSEGFLFFFRADGNRFYLLNFGGWNNAQHAVQKGYDDGNWSIFGSQAVGGSVSSNQWYDIRVRCEGNRFQCWLGATKVFDFTDESAYLSGGVGLGTWSTQSRYRNIAVKSLDGTVLYSGMPTRTSNARLVRARACKAGYIPSPTVTQTYFVDPGIASRYTIPVVSLAAEEPDFFGYEQGIYVAGKNRDDSGVPNYILQGNAWERPLNITLFEPDGTVGFSQDAGVRTHGGWTRNMAQKALRFYARGGYGESYFTYPVFPGKPVAQFKRLLLRNSGNDWGVTMFRDAMMQRLVEHLPLDTQAYRPAVMYLNGEYWGINNLRERFDKYYLEQKYGVDPEAVDILEYLPNAQHQVKEGSASHFDETLSYIQTHGLAAPADYAYIQTRVDTDNFILYNVSQIYFNNTDWPGNNNDWWRKQTDAYEPSAPYGHDGRWRWMLYDTDFGFGLSGGYDSNTLAFATDGNTNNTAWPNPHWTTFLLRKLLENESFRTDFINHYADLLNTAFLPARVVGVIDQMQADIATEMAAHIQRWGRPGSIGDWQNQVNGMRNFANERPAYARSHLRSQFSLGVDRQLTLNVSGPEQGYIRVNSTDITAATPGVNAAAPYPWSGVYFDSVPMTVTAVPRPGYLFSHWDGPAGIDPLAPALTLSLTSAVSLTAYFEEKPVPTLMHYWSFNNAASLLEPTYTFGAAAVTVLPGSTTAVLSGTGQDFAGLNNRQEELTGAHLRVNNPLGATLTLLMPTRGYEDIVLMYETRRSGQGAGTQIVSYSVDGTTFTPFQTIFVFDAAPTLQTFDFTGVAGVRNNPNFAIRVEFAQGDGGTTGNNRFDNITLEGTPLEGTNLPPQWVTPIPLQKTIEQDAPFGVDLSGYFGDADGDILVFTAVSDKPFVAGAAVSGKNVVLIPQSRGDAVITVTAADGVNAPLQASFRVLVYPAAQTLRLGAFRFGAWSPEYPDYTFPGSMLFLQSDVTDPGLGQALDYAYFFPHDDYQTVDAGVIGYPYKATARTRINGLGEAGISFINSGRERDLGGALVALDTTGLDAVRVNWLAGTVLQNFRRYAIRLQYRVGIDGAFADVLAAGQPVEYVVQTDGHTQDFGPIELPAEAANQPYVQLLWRYYFIDVTSGARAQLRLDDITVSGVLDVFGNVGLFAQWWLTNDCGSPDHCGGADLTRNGRVDLEDFSILVAQWVENP